MAQELVKSPMTAMIFGFEVNFWPPERPPLDRPGYLQRPSRPCGPNPAGFVDVVDGKPHPLLKEHAVLA